MVEFAEKLQEVCYTMSTFDGVIAQVIERRISVFDDIDFMTLNYGSFFAEFESLQYTNYNEEAKVKLKTLSNCIDEYVESNDLYIYTFDDVQPKFEMWVRE